MQKARQMRTVRYSQSKKLFFGYDRRRAALAKIIKAIKEHVIHKAASFLKFFLIIRLSKTIVKHPETF